MAVDIRAEADAKAEAQDKLDEIMIETFAIGEKGTHLDLLLFALCRRVKRIEKALAIR